AWDDMAILYRGNALSRSFEEALIRARVPCMLIGDVGFYQRAEIKDALALLRLAATPDDALADEAFRRGINVPARGFGAETSEGRLENMQELVQLAGGFHTARELLDHAAFSTGGPGEEETGRVQLM